MIVIMVAMTMTIKMAMTMTKSMMWTRNLILKILVAKRKSC